MIRRVPKEIQIAVDCADPERLARFWADALGYRVEGAESDDSDDWSAVVDPGGVGPRVLFHRVPEEKVVKNRLHLDVRAGGPRGIPKDVREPVVDAEVSRLVAFGATYLRTENDEADYFAVMQDPEGNEFCIC